MGSLTQGRKVAAWEVSDGPRAQQPNLRVHLEVCSLSPVPHSLLTEPTNLLRQVGRHRALTSAVQQNFLW